MRITLVMASCEDGGLEKHVIELANGLANEHDVSVIAHQRFKIFFNNNVQCICFDMSGSRHNPWTKYQLLKKIKMTQPNIVHAHASKTAQLMSGLIDKISVPCVVTIHGAKSKLKHYFAFDHIIAVSQKLAEQIDLPSKTSVIYNGVDLSEKPNKWEKNRKFIAIGRLNEVKGFDILITAWKDIDAELNIYGEGEEFDRLQKLIGDLGSESRIKLCGFSHEIQKKISHHEALVVSSHREGGPYTLSEALLLNRPVFGTDVGMMSEFVPKDLLCQPASVAKLHAVILKYLELDHPLDNYVPYFSKAQQHLSFNMMLNHTCEIYSKLIQDGVA
ncbi:MULTISPECIES: glycosyltransferase [unclassified Acinetobacter]|uniref:glycosyltransferase n=1 Tax=unclassified Acinetobacter TaxID=196816 RepID=UPI000DCF8A3C|nr:glycosyltransferase [Acinetobacter sp. CFCC 11171]